MKKTFDEIVIFARTGLNPRANFKLGHGSNKYITIKNIHNNTLTIDENTESIDDTAVELIHKRSQIKKGDILFCSIGRIGDMYIIPNAPIGWDINESVFAFTLNTDLIRQKYFYYIFKSITTIKYLQKNSSGSTFKSIKMNQLRRMVFEIPTLDVQDRIVSTLDSASEIINLRKQQLQQLDELVKSRFVEMFGDVTLNPNGYPVKKFESISTLITDGEHATPRRTTKGIYLLSARNILNHKLQLSDVDYIDEEEYNRIARRVVPQAGDILVSCSGSIGRCCVVPSGLRFQMVRSTALIRFDDTINPIFAEWLITSDELQRQIMQAATQSSQANLFQGKIRKLYGFIPPIDLQNDFAEFVKQVDKSKFCVTNYLRKIQLIKGELL